MPSEPYNVSKGDILTAGWMNSVVGSVRRRNNRSGRGVQWGTGSGSEDCPFGEVISLSAGPHIRSGVLFAGDKTLNVPDYKINTTVNGTWLVEIELDVEANRDTNNEIILPGIKTTTDTPAYKLKVFTDGTNYDDNIQPEVDDGKGTIFVPIGKLIIKTNSPTLENVGCGNIRIDQCAGILKHDRT